LPWISLFLSLIFYWQHLGIIVYFLCLIYGLIFALIYKDSQKCPNAAPFNAAKTCIKTLFIPVQVQDIVNKEKIFQAI